MKQRAATGLDRASGYFFTAGFFISRMRVLPFAILNSVLNLTSLLAYLVGYIAWFAATLFYTDRPRSDAWYGFAEFKQQYQISSVIGTAATIICLTYPPLIIPALWLFVVSNFIWGVSEYHKKNNPALWDNDFSSARHDYYLNYVYLMTTVSLLTAGASTLALYVPTIAAATLMASTIVGSALTVVAFYYWYTQAYGHYKPNRVQHSYNSMAEILGNSPSVENTLEDQLELEDTQRPITPMRFWRPTPPRETVTEQSCLQTVLSV